MFWAQLIKEMYDYLGSATTLYIALGFGALAFGVGGSIQARRSK